MKGTMVAAIISSLFLTSGCSMLTKYGPISSNERKSLIWEKGITENQRSYIEKVRGTSTQFEIQKAEGEQAWGRTVSFVGKYAGMKIQSATDYSISTFNSFVDEYAGCKMAYSVTKSPTNSGYTFNVDVDSASLGTKACVLGKERNAYILSHYIQTGELPHPELIER